MKDFTVFLIACLWFIGMVLADGFWSTFSAIVFPPWSWYLCAESFVKLIGV